MQNSPLLLDATGAYHREVIKQMDPSIVHYSTPMMQRQNPKQTKILLVTLAETTPVLEAASLQVDLRRAGIEAWAWIINTALLQQLSTHPYCASASNELADIEAVSTIHAQRFAVVSLLKEEPVGVQRLLELSENNR